MITNERQYRITNRELRKLKAALEAFDLDEAVARTGSAALAKAEYDALESQVEELIYQVSEYEMLKAGVVETLRARNLDKLPTILIKARIANGLSQRELAEILGLKEQQIQRYEAQNYASASLKRLVDVAKALNLEIIEFAEPAGLIPAHGRARAGDNLDWSKFPVKEMYRRNWFKGFTGSLDDAIEKAESLAEDYVRGIMGEATPMLLRSRVRAGSIMDRYALIAWQCRVLSVASEDPPEKHFRRQCADSEWLRELVRCSRYEDGPRRAVEYLRETGISVVIEPHLQNTYLDGAALLNKGWPVIAMTLRYDRLDNFWFVLLHEVFHVIKHLRQGQLEDIFDDLDAKADELEGDADQLAGDALVPDAIWETASARFVQSADVVVELAGELGISPAIIAGRIRRECNNYAILAELVGQGEVRKQFGGVHFGQ